MDNINYHWLETEEERRFVLDRILFLFQHRKPTDLESVETMAERVFEDEDIVYKKICCAHIVNVRSCFATDLSVEQER